MHNVFFVLRHLPVFRILFLFAAVGRAFLYWLHLHKVERSSVPVQLSRVDHLAGKSGDDSNG